MVVVIIKQQICNVCRDPDRPTKRYNLSSEGRRVSPDLCDEHAEPIEALLDQEEAPRQGSAKRLSPAEITAAKRAYKRAAKKA